MAKRVRKTFKELFEQGVKDAGWERTAEGQLRPAPNRDLIVDEIVLGQPLPCLLGTTDHVPCPSCEASMVIVSEGRTCSGCGYKEAK